MWDDLMMVGGTEWIAEAAKDKSLVTVTDRSCLKELYPNLCSAAFVFDFSKGYGRIAGAFPEKYMVANVYHGELVGLMTVHLLLLSVNKIDLSLPGLMQIFSDCLGTLSRVVDWIPHRIPTNCRHSEIL